MKVGMGERRKHMSSKLIEGSFTHVVMEGTSYEIGKMQGEWLKENPGYVQFMTTLMIEGFTPKSQAETDEAMEFFDRYSPGLNEEIQGFADTLGVPVEQIVYYTLTHFGKGHCSHFAVLPEATKDGHMLVGRSYEWNMNDDFRLCTTRVKGMAAHLGFSLFLFGRIDGFNEHGLCVTMSAGVPGSDPRKEGCRFWAVIRTILDRCKTVDEALELAQSIPIAFNMNLILADQSGQAILNEIACQNRAVKRIGPETPKKFIHATNHYNLPEMIQYDLGRRWHSVVRYQAIESRLRAAIPNVDKEDLRKLLTDLMPAGVCGHHYSEGFGTLWSIIYDLTERKAEIALGSPATNPYRSFGLNDPVGKTTYVAKFPDVTADPVMWRSLDPGSWK
jgi:predicted choloylglycine hydrolase